jgi:hypothetical protein
MTGTDRDFERIARAWLELGPTEAPDRPVAAALQAIESTPQSRRPIRWPLRRPTTMTRLPLLAALAGIIVLSVGVLFLVGGGPGPLPAPSPVPSPSPTPTVTPTPTAASPGPVPDALLGGWVAPTRTADGETAGSVTSLTLGSNAGQVAVDLLTPQPFTAGEIEPGVLRLIATTNGVCDSTDTGLYAYDASVDGWLTLEASEDECADRAIALTGSWQRSLTHGSEGGPGIMAAFAPYFTVTLPPGTYSGRGNTEMHQSVVDASNATYKAWRDLDGFLDPCDIDAGRLLLEPGMDAFLAYLTEDPRFIVEEQEEFEIDGHRAVEIRFRTGTLDMAPCWTLDGDPNDRNGVLTWIPERAPGGFWNGEIGTEDALVVTEVGDATIVFEFLTIDGTSFEVDRETLSTVRFLDELPDRPAP